MFPSCARAADRWRNYTAVEVEYLSDESVTTQYPSVIFGDWTVDTGSKT